MSLLIESKKLKRTGYLPAFLAGGFLAAAFPVVYMMVKAEEMTALAGNPINILMSANWQMMAMLNILISICGACMMYHTEYADNGMQKMSVLPIRQGSMFFGKFLIAALVLSAMVVIEMSVLVGCAKYWFPSYVFDLTEILKTAGFQIIVTLPTVTAKAKHKESKTAVRIFIFFISSPANPRYNIHTDNCDCANRINTVNHDTYLHKFGFYFSFGIAENGKDT